MHKTVIIERRRKGDSVWVPLAFTAWNGETAAQIAGERQARNPNFEYRA